MAHRCVRYSPVPAIVLTHVVGLSLRDPNSTNTPLVASDADKILGDSLDAYLLGNVGVAALFL